MRLRDKDIVYLDYAATTPVDPRVADKIAGCLTLEGVFGNPASLTHAPGRAARDLVEEARAQVAGLVRAEPREIVWTSGATEADNLAIAGFARRNRDRGRHIVTSRTEHRAVLDTCKALEKEGFEVTWLVPERDGLIDPGQVGQAIRADTLLVSIMHVNNETGVIQDIGAIGRVCRERGVAFHVDAAQSAGKLPIDLGALPVDLMAFSAHKIYGPKGVGALYVRREPRCRLDPLIHGGGHETGLRSGTLANHQIAGMGEAFAIAARDMEHEASRLESMRERLWAGLRGLGGVHLNGHPERRVAGILNVSFEGVHGESLVHALRTLAVSSGSACNAAEAEPSYVLRALGRSDELARSTLRFSVGRFTTEADLTLAIEVIGREVPRLRAIWTPGNSGPSHRS